MKTKRKRKEEGARIKTTQKKGNEKMQKPGGRKFMRTDFKMEEMGER